MKRALVPAAGIVLALLLLAAGGTYAVVSHAPATSTSVQIGGPFRLVDGDGHTLADTDFRGRWMLVYFGYTHCPDVCPTSLSDISNALDQLTPDQRAKIAALFVTVDPERDTPAVMKDYVSGFGSAILGLSGDAQAISKAEEAYRVYAAKHVVAGGDYEMDHSSIIYVMDPQGRFTASFSQDDTPARIAAKLRQLGA